MSNFFKLSDGNFVNIEYVMFTHSRLADPFYGSKKHLFSLRMANGHDIIVEERDEEAIKKLLTNNQYQSTIKSNQGSNH